MVLADGWNDDFVGKNLLAALNALHELAGFRAVEVGVVAWRLRGLVFAVPQIEPALCRSNGGFELRLITAREFDDAPVLEMREGKFGELILNGDGQGLRFAAGRVPGGTQGGPAFGQRKTEVLAGF